MARMDVGGYTILAVNLVLGFGFALPLARRFTEVVGRPDKVTLCFVVLVAVYFVECVAFSAGMATNVFTVALAFVWGAVLGLWSRHFPSPKREVIKTTVYFSLYSSMPAISFLSVLVMLAFSGWPVLTPDGGVRFGVPRFIPWPLNTLLGFFMAVAVSAVVLKTAITTGVVGLIIRSRERPLGVKNDTFNV